MKRINPTSLVPNKEVDEDIKKSKMDTCKNEGIKHFPLCPDDLTKIATVDGAMSRNFPVYDITSPHKTDLQIRGYVDYYGGYAEHTRQAMYGLANTGKYNIKLTPIKTPVDIDVFKWQKNNWFINNTIDTSKADLLVIAGAGWLQEKYLPQNDRNVLAWTMIEGRTWNEECAEWLKNASYILCPTITDCRRAEEAGVGPSRIKHMRLGYDDKLFNEETRRMQFVGLENRFVFGVLGSWNVRKGVKDIVKAYVSAFKKEEPVTLLLMCKYGTRPYADVERDYWPDDEERWTIQYELNEALMEIGVNKNDCPHIALMDIPVHENIIANAMARFDCLVGFSAGESTWLPGLQAMAMRIPVIQLASECSGFMEYMTDENSFLCHTVKYRKAGNELVLGTSDYYKGQEFAFGDFRELADKMQHVRKHYQTDGYNRVTQALSHMRHGRWTWNDSTFQLDRFLTSIRG